MFVLSTLYSTPTKVLLALSRVQRAKDSHFVCLTLNCTVKKVRGFPVPSRDVTYQTLPGRDLCGVFLELKAKMIIDLWNRINEKWFLDQQLLM